eukprot:Blabericola_migrator_1__1142@NODE_1293_length_4881_cov_191_333818_g872_i0_p3_GENE_NODE_1293_length_4881_cov_191_333818_g872_i0NODE_1293_length_4881_cov_191_333818_g872_i0_p3_ORF_typecomplete_len389_score34_60API5/PF05918_11/0_12_NODE_1293_length_4881_cov_191_333818_g872_i05051671
MDFGGAHMLTCWEKIKSYNQQRRMTFLEGPGWMLCSNESCPKEAPMRSYWTTTATKRKPPSTKRPSKRAPDAAWGAPLWGGRKQLFFRHRPRDNWTDDRCVNRLLAGGSSSCDDRTSTSTGRSEDRVSTGLLSSRRSSSTDTTCMEDDHGPWEAPRLDIYHRVCRCLTFHFIKGCRNVPAEMHQPLASHLQHIFGACPYAGHFTSAEFFRTASNQGPPGSIEIGGTTFFFPRDQQQQFEPACPDVYSQQASPTAQPTPSTPLLSEDEALVVWKFLQSFISRQRSQRSSDYLEMIVEQADQRMKSESKDPPLVIKVGNSHWSNSVAPDCWLAPPPSSKSPLGQIARSFSFRFLFPMSLEAEEARTHWSTSSSFASPPTEWQLSTYLQNH